MSSETIVIIITAALCFACSFVGFHLLNHFNAELSARKNTPFVVILPVFALASLFLFFNFQDGDDFIYPLKISELLAPLFISGIIYFSSWQNRFPSLQYIFILIGATTVVYLTPNEFQLIPELNLYLNQGLLILLLFAFSSLFQYLNGLDGILGIQSIGISLGLFALSLIGGAPQLLGIYALCLATITLAFLIFNWYPAKLSLVPAGSNALGFLLGWLMLRGTIEGSGPSILVFMMFFVVEMLIAGAKKLTLRNQFRVLITNTTYYQANVSGFPPFLVANNILRLQIVLLILGCFELYSPNIYSIPVFSFLITIWYLSKLKNWQHPSKTIRELNQDLMTDIKSNLTEIKDKFNKDQ